MKSLLIFQIANTFLSHFLFLYMILNSKQATAKTIPSNTRVLKITVSSSLKVFMMLIGVPSGGTPSVYYGQKSNIV